jgi:hypothetical protein
MTECTRNIELFFILNCLTPDYRTIWQEWEYQIVRKIYKLYLIV